MDTSVNSGKQNSQPSTKNTSETANPTNDESLTTVTQRKIQTHEIGSGVKVKRLPERPRGLIQGN